MSLWWRLPPRAGPYVVVSSGYVTWHRVVTSVKADGDGGLVLTWGWRVDPVTPGDWWVDVLVAEVVG